MRNVLVSGAGVAGSALAYWLTRNGFAVTVVERAESLRKGGQAIDVRGVALQVIDRMGLGEQLRAARTQMRGMSMMDRDGNEMFRSEEKTLSAGRLDSDDIEVLREDLTAMIYEATKDGVEYVFDDTITALHQEDHGVRVEFEKGGYRTFDFVIGADGMHSRVRGLAFGAEEKFIQHLGSYIAVFPSPNFLELDNWQVWIQDQESGAGGGVYPVRDNSELRATFGFMSDRIDYDYRDVAQHKKLMADHLSHLGWEMPKFIEVMTDAPDFYFDAMAQIHMDKWSTGRVALVGDAAYCASVLSGQGTSIALVGAYILAEELGKADHAEAFAAYERRMRSYAELNQALATENPGQPASEESMEKAKNAISL
ncbi:FAD-dependent monooxygenase [Kibdelosporangium philippinense]|uniref:FAD-dependent monooxygenase n=1 Tax=Kibdelosporangium philippinense TaxID=211113 RepID=A0ABS8ZYT5_9PSEU|nr:FAD-dependent monooxygenase [Kibdelosporangium philippinense]MCE7011352.1 FAD-dependent monooxygenase [Kibdelosporangium philippinense]